MSTLQLLGLLAVGACILTSLLVAAIRQPRQVWLAPALAVLGLWVVAAALEVLKNRAHGGLPEWKNPAFKVVRNAESLAGALVPLELAAFVQPSLRRAAAAALGLTGLALLILPGWAAIHSWNQVFSAQAAVMSIPGAWLLGRDGDLAAGRWIWFIGSALMAMPTVRVLLRSQTEQQAAQAPGLGFTLLGMGVSSLAMGIFFWHQSDLRHRDVAVFFIMLGAYAAPLLALGHGRIATARWAQHALGVFGVLIAVWMLTGVGEGDFPSGRQDFADLWPSMTLLILMLLIPPVLAVHLAVQAFRRAWAQRRLNPPLGGIGSQHLE